MGESSEQLIRKQENEAPAATPGEAGLDRATPGGEAGLDRAAPGGESQLADVIGRDALQNIQNRFASLGRTTVCIATVDGESITEPTWGSRFTKLIGISNLGRGEWIKSLRACADDPASCDGIMCHEGMRLYSAPILYENNRLAVLIVGTRAHPVPTAEQVKQIAHQYCIDEGELQASIIALDTKRGGSPEDIQRFADLLAHILSTLYGQARRIGRQLRDLQIVHDLAQLLSGTLDLQEILDKTVRRVVEVMDVKACAIRLLDVETGELVIKAVHNLSEEYLRKGPVLLQNSPIDAAAFADESVYIENVPTDGRIRYPDNARREGLVSGLCVSLTYRGQTIGVIRVYTGRKHTFTDLEVSLLRSIGSQAASAIIHSRLYQERAITDRVHRQMETAGQIQRRMVPPAPPPKAGYDFGCIYDPSLEVGGDFYDFIELPDGDLGICIADVSGKGIPAALFMASIRSTLRAFAPTSDDVTRIMRHVNRQLCNDTLVGEFATLFYGVLSAEGRTLTYCNAGHVQPMILRGHSPLKPGLAGGREFFELEAGGMALGIRGGESYDHEQIRLQEGDIVVLITDGVPDAMDFQGTAYGRERFLASIEKHRHLDAQLMAQQLQWDVRRFAGLAEQADDITIVVVKVV